MDNYVILSSKDGDKWAKVASNMTSVKLGACIHIVGLSSFWGTLHHSDHHLSPDSSITEIYSQSSRSIDIH